MCEIPGVANLIYFVANPEAAAKIVFGSVSPGYGGTG